MSILKSLVFASFVATVSIVNAEPHCPGTSQFTLAARERSQIVVPITINHAGPYDFLVDTGAQVTTVDPALAAELHLKTQGTAGVTGVGVSARAPLTQLGSVEAGSHELEKVLAVIQNLGQTALADRRCAECSVETSWSILICSSIIRMTSCASTIRRRCGKKVKGQHIPFSAQPVAQGGAPAPQKLIVAVHLPGIAKGCYACNWIPGSICRSSTERVKT